MVKEEVNNPKIDNPKKFQFQRGISIILFGGVLFSLKYAPIITFKQSNVSLDYIITSCNLMRNLVSDCSMFQLANTLLIAISIMFVAYGFFKLIKSQFDKI